MQNYPENIELKLGFDVVREHLRTACVTQPGRELVDQLEFSSESMEIRRRLTLTHELKELIIQGNRPPEIEFFQVGDAIKLAKIEGSMLSLEQLSDIQVVLNAANDTLKYLKQFRNDAPELFSQFEDLKVDKELLGILDRSIDERGQVKDSASKDLQRIRKSIIRCEQQARNKLNRSFGEAKKSGYTPEGTSITIRSGRLVLPVLSEHKRKIKGFVQDMSSTGGTLFIEPEEVLELNNELREWQHQERREINRILKDLTVRIRDHEGVEALPDFLSEIDFIRAKARFAISTESVLPQIQDQPVVNWVDARHPLLYLSFKSQDKSVVDQSFQLDKEDRLILVSGPNAGGKSVCLKTLGLIQYMAQCGLEVPVAENSQLGIFKNLFIDIGDEQSLENDLSTYSSHLLNMRWFMTHSDQDTLILIDEFGTGTDPEYGGAIAEAVLTHLLKTGARGMITTHYGNLKQFAENHEGIVNGAMQFDTVNLEPKYKLMIGKPGSSFALEIAQKIGLDKNALDLAKEIIGTEKVQLDELISSLEKEKQNLQDQLKSSEKLNERLKNDIDRYLELKDSLEERKSEILNKAKDSAEQLVKEANVKIERTIREIRESGAEKERTKTKRSELKQFEQKLVRKPKKKRRQKQAEDPVIEGPIQVDDRVRIKGQETKGTVIKISGKDAEVMFGELRSKIKLNRLEKIASGPRKEVKRTKKVQGLDLNRKMADFSSELNVRGMRVEQLLPELERYMDNALMFNASVLRIVHGKGNGVLREVVRDHLKGYKEVARISDEHADRGGAGVTIVELK